MAKGLVPLIGFLLFSWACSSEPSPPPISVTLSPENGTVHVDKTLQFTATVRHATNTSVNWILSGDGCSGTSCGTIGNTGLYTAPTSAPEPPFVTVTARSVADPSKSANAILLLLGPVRVTVQPRDLHVTVGATLWLGALVDNAVDSRVTWSLSGATGSGPEYGTITAEGRYTAPDAVPADPVVTITATSLEDTGVSGSTTVTVRPPGIIEYAWTWTSGSDTANQRGTYGTKGVAELSNIPGSRGCAASWLDPAGNLWLFGGGGPGPGIGSVYFNDLWTYDVAACQWTWMSGSDQGDQPGSYGTKGVAGPLNAPGARINPLSWSDPGGKLWLFGGMGYHSAVTCAYLNDLWMFDLATREWTWVSGSNLGAQLGVYGTKGIPDPSNIPGARYRSAAWIDGNGKLWLFGGWGFNAIGGAYMLNDLWCFDPGTSLWTWVSGTDQLEDAGEYGTKGVPSTQNLPTSRCDATTWIDDHGNLWLFGGYDYYAGWELNFDDLWRFNPATLEWTWVSGSDWPNELGFYGIKGVPDPRNVPGGRSGAVSWLDPGGGFWIFGGDGYNASGYAGYLNDLWRFDTATLEWTWISGCDYYQFDEMKGVYGVKHVADILNVPGARVFPLAWRDASGRFWLFGGSGFDSANIQGALNDLWYLTRIPPEPAPKLPAAGTIRSPAL